MSFIDTIKKINPNNPKLDIGIVKIGPKNSLVDCTISGFISKLNKGLARSNRYRVEFFLPPGIQDSIPNLIVGTALAAYNPQSLIVATTATQQAMNGDGRINMFCHTASFPMRSILSRDHTMYGSPYKVPYSQSNDQASFSFYGDYDLNTRQFFDIWQQAVVNVKSNTMNYYNEFVSDVNLSIVDNEGKDQYSVTLYEAWPSSIGAVDLSYGSQNGLVNVNITLSFKYWKAKILSKNVGPVNFSI